MTNQEFQNLADTYNISTYELSDLFDKAHEMLNEYILKEGYKYTVTIDNGEVYYRFIGEEGEQSEWFEENVQALFDNFF